MPTKRGWGSALTFTICVSLAGPLVPPPSVSLWTDKGGGRKLPEVLLLAHPVLSKVFKDGGTNQT